MAEVSVRKGYFGQTKKAAGVECLQSAINNRKSEICLVPSKGLEPPHRCRYMDLNHARLPIPPRWQVDFNHGSGTPPHQEDLLFYSTGTKKPVKPLTANCPSN